MKSKMFQSNKINNSLGTILAKEIEIHGNINVKGNIIIYGKVYGNINSTGIVNTAKESIIEGDIEAKNAFISGKVKGHLNIENKVVLGSTGDIEGNIKSAILTIEEGANFEGMCNMLQQSAKSKVKKINALNS